MFGFESVGEGREGGKLAWREGLDGWMVGRTHCLSSFDSLLR